MYIVYNSSPIVVGDLTFLHVVCKNNKTNFRNTRVRRRKIQFNYESKGEVVETRKIQIYTSNVMYLITYLIKQYLLYLNVLKELKN